jgi:hypothetical protein
VRECGGVPLVLNQSGIDELNPGLKAQIFKHYLLFGALEGRTGLKILFILFLFPMDRPHWMQRLLA